MWGKCFLKVSHHGGWHVSLQSSRVDCAPGVAEVAGALTPVPGGVGPMTVAMLMTNTVTAAED